MGAWFDGAAPFSDLECLACSSIVPRPFLQFRLGAGTFWLAAGWGARRERGGLAAVWRGYTVTLRGASTGTWTRSGEVPPGASANGEWLLPARPSSRAA